MDRLRSERLTKMQLRRKWGHAIIFTILSFIVLISMIAFVPAVSPAVGAQAADAFRSVLGPQPVATVESVSFWLQDQFYQLQANLEGGRVGISFNQQPAAQQAIPDTGIPIPDTKTLPKRSLNNTQASVPAVENAAEIPVPIINAITANPQIGWKAYGPNVNGKPAMAQVLLTLDPQRSYAGIVVVRVDLTLLQLHMMPGFLEPSHAAEVVNAIPNLGTVPNADRSQLIAGFNGGFKSVNGKYGMVFNGITLLPPLNGIATVALFKDGHVQIGTWAQDLFPGDPNLIALRQNCPPILVNGEIDPRVYVDASSLWGETIGNQSITWRTGLGLSQDGRYLIYAVGNGTSVVTLAQALQMGGAYNAMQLDINRHYSHFVTYTPTGNHLAATQLLNQMENDPTLYLIPHSRDFFYLTTR